MDPTPYLQDTTLPPGAIVAFAGQVINPQAEAEPDTGKTMVEAWGWMVCDGRSLKVSEYPELFMALGYLYGGSGDTFNLPDLRGMFLRGVGSSELVKEDAVNEGRTAAKNGETDGVGSTQDFALQKHVHIYEKPGEPKTNNQGKAPGMAIEDKEPDATGEPVQSLELQSGNVKVSDYETRPSNILVYYLIKYTTKLPVFSA